MFPQLSAGTRMAINLARCVCQDPELLILDEPLRTGYARNHKLVKDVIKAFCARKDKTLIIVTHYQEELPATITNSFVPRNTNK